MSTTFDAQMLALCKLHNLTNVNLGVSPGIEYKPWTAYAHSDDGLGCGHGDSPLAALNQAIAEVHSFRMPAAVQAVAALPEAA